MPTKLCSMHEFREKPFKMLFNFPEYLIKTYLYFHMQNPYYFEIEKKSILWLFQTILKGPSKKCYSDSQVQKLSPVLTCDEAKYLLSRKCHPISSKIQKHALWCETQIQIINLQKISRGISSHICYFYSDICVWITISTTNIWFFHS